MRILISEDETAAAENLKYLLRKIDPSIEIAAYTESVEQTVDLLQSNPPIDLIFMDIHLSDGSAFAIFDKISVDIPIIFTTAYDQYALNAFKVNSIDYLLKPMKNDDLRRALDKYRKLSKPELAHYLSSMAALRLDKDYLSRLIVPLRDKFLPIAVDEIGYVYSAGRRTKIVLKDGSELPINKTLEALESSLNPLLFIRANKQFIISKNIIKELVAWFDSRLKVILNLETPEDIFISKNNAAEFKQWLSR